MTTMVMRGKGCSCHLALLLLVLFTVGIVDGSYPIAGGAAPRQLSASPYIHLNHVVRHVDTLKSSLAAGAPSPSPAISSRVYHVTDYGADPTGSNDSTAAISKAISDAFNSPFKRSLMPGIADLGGAEVHLDGGEYLITSPLTLPSNGGGNVKIHGGSLRASDDFPTGRYLVELWANPQSGSLSSSTSGNYAYEYVSLTGLMLDANFRGGGIAVVDSLRITIDNCYIVHFTSDGILVNSGHETYIHNSYIGQHITAGGDPGERNFTGVGINLMGNDNAVTDVVIFSAAVGIMVSGQANSLFGVHCYNKATGWGGVGIYVKLPELSQTRIVNCYLDYTGIVAEDPDQLLISSSFFLGSANVVLKSVKGVIKAVQIVDNTFSGGGADIVRLDESAMAFTKIDQVFVQRNVVDGMTLRSTVAKATVDGNGTSWAVDFSSVLLFPNRIEHVQYTLRCTGSAFPKHALRNVSNNKAVVESDVAVSATVNVMVDQNSS